MTRWTLLLLLPTIAAGFAGLGSKRQNGAQIDCSSSCMNRRQTLSQIVSGTAAALVATTLPRSSNAAVSEETPRVTTRMGGLLEKYQDGPRGFTTLAPSGWNKFEGEVGAYDVKWQDLVNQSENIKLSSTPVKSTTTSISALGEDVQAIGESLAAKRNAKLVRATERQTDGILFYEFEFAIKDGTHQLLVLSVNKGKIWSLDLNASEKRWPKREELYANIAGSFMPKLN